MSLDTKTTASPALSEDYLSRGRRLTREIDPYLPGLTRTTAASMVNVPPHRVAKLSSNENPLGPSPKVLQAIADMNWLVHEYPSPSAEELRKTIGTYLGVGADQVVVSSGSSTLMHAIVDAFSLPGGEVISLDPGFTVYPEIATIHGRTAKVIPLNEDDFLLDIEVLKKAITPATQIIFLTRPNNPTSTMIPIEVFAEAAKLAAEVGALIVSDEAYIEFADMPGQSAVELLKSDPETYKNVMFSRTCSKAFGVANMRVGYAVALPEVAECLALANAKWPTGAVAQAAAIAAIEDTEHLAKTLAMVAQGRKYLIDELNAMGLPVAPNPQGNYVMFDIAPTGLSAEEFSDKVFHDAAVLIRGDFSPRYIRASIGTPEENQRLVVAARKLAPKA
ncbi:aminotransferase class I/II-fold pyridoxal phosphate-dependent enzyme [Salipiger sp. P9]|uniref:pyridoxal phosphate-dependent aminotransferase n=1 Tax=Salipiger pentaromativorans TaxID=2943193 RepID=UPI002157FB91|nr:histidinol-phosphate transaminase [Salipiger pentaromativorans]MCR8547518.1 aminotransferase class I/II-fold pyridoxal phosphate-dependent enzyme [Salipiger pentaromativorans]